MSEQTRKPIVVVRVAEKSMEGAIRRAMERAQQTLGGLDSLEVAEVRGLLRDGKVRQFQVKMRVGLRLLGQGGIPGA